MRSKIFGMVNSGRISNGARISVYWMYGVNPNTDRAYIDLYGIDIYGEHLLETFELEYVADNYTGTVFEYISEESEYPFVYAKVRDNNTVCLVKDLALHSFVTPMSDDSNAITEIS